MGFDGKGLSCEKFLQEALKNPHEKFPCRGTQKSWLRLLFSIAMKNYFVEKSFHPNNSRVVTASPSSKLLWNSITIPISACPGLWISTTAPTFSHCSCSDYTVLRRPKPSVGFQYSFALKLK